MVLEIVQKSHFIVPANFMSKNKPFYSYREQIPVFNGYSYYFNCEDKDENIAIFLYMVITKPVTVSCSITVNSITRNYVHTFEESEGWGFPQFSKKSELFVDGFMIVDTKLNIEFISENIKVFKGSPHTDFTICVENKEIEVHKSILAVASPVFAAMLESHTKEFEEGRVDIEDFDFETVKAGVDLIYIRQIYDTLSVKVLLNVGKFADKYDLIDKKKVFEKLTEKISLETILEITKFSKVNSMNEFYEKCVEFYANDFDEISRKIDGFQQLDPQFVVDAANKKYRLAK
uniref:BTB domain-containing protein n=1 Tax=Panagrolaimus sp. JU765 TaxID=591449 RepID=A0AC34QBN3_9BILA